jgi:hypothetical protein
MSLHAHKTITILFCISLSRGLIFHCLNQCIVPLSFLSFPISLHIEFISGYSLLQKCPQLPILINRTTYRSILSWKAPWRIAFFQLSFHSWWNWGQKRWSDLPKVKYWIEAESEVFYMKLNFTFVNIQCYSFSKRIYKAGTILVAWGKTEAPTDTTLLLPLPFLHRSSLLGVYTVTCCYIIFYSFIYFCFDSALIFTQFQLTSPKLLI